MVVHVQEKDSIFSYLLHIMKVHLLYICLLFITLTQRVDAVPPPVCEQGTMAPFLWIVLSFLSILSHSRCNHAGFGVTELGGVNLYGEASPGLCEACQVDNCLDCLNYYKRCEGCKTGYGPSEEFTRPGRRRLLQDAVANDQYVEEYNPAQDDYGQEYDDTNSAEYVESNSFDSCTKCSDDGCGVCQEVYSKCNGYITDCDKSVTQVGTASEVSMDAIDQCSGEPGFAGNGYTSKRIYTVIDGNCAECGTGTIGYTWYWYPLDTATGEVATYCWMDGQMRSVAANALTASDECPYPGTVTLKLTNLCYSNNRGVAFNVYGTFEGAYCGITKTIYVNGESIFGPVWEKLESGDSDAITWTYAATEGMGPTASDTSPSPTTATTTTATPASSPSSSSGDESSSVQVPKPSDTITAGTSPAGIAKVLSVAFAAFLILI